MNLKEFLEELQNLQCSWKVKNGNIVNENNDTPGQALARSKGMDLRNEMFGNIKFSENLMLHKLGVQNHELVCMAVLGGFGGLYCQEQEIRRIILKNLGLKISEESYCCLD